MALASSAGGDGGVGRGAEDGGAAEERRLKKSVWNCDGETILDTAVEVKMHRKVR